MTIDQRRRRSHAEPPTQAAAPVGPLPPSSPAPDPTVPVQLTHAEYAILIEGATNLINTLEHALTDLCITLDRYAQGSTGWADVIHTRDSVRGLIHSISVPTAPPPD
jgi:hypothetical protein